MENNKKHIITNSEYKWHFQSLSECFVISSMNSYQECNNNFTIYNMYHVRDMVHPRSCSLSPKLEKMHVLSVTL